MTEIKISYKDYKNLHFKGGGAVGKVYEGEHKGDKVALKFLWTATHYSDMETVLKKPELATEYSRVNDQQLKAAKKEVVILRHFKTLPRPLSDSVPQIHAEYLEREEPIPFVVMELMKDPALSRFSEPLVEPLALELTRRLLLLMHELHVHFEDYLIDSQYNNFHIPESQNKVETALRYENIDVKIIDWNVVRPLSQPPRGIVYPVSYDIWRAFAFMLQMMTGLPIAGSYSRLGKQDFERLTSNKPDTISPGTLNLIRNVLVTQIGEVHLGTAKDMAELIEKRLKLWNYLVGDSSGIAYELQSKLEALDLGGGWQHDYVWFADHQNGNLQKLHLYNIAKEYNLRAEDAVAVPPTLASTVELLIDGNPKEAFNRFTITQKSLSRTSLQDVDLFHFRIGYLLYLLQDNDTFYDGRLLKILGYFRQRPGEGNHDHFPIPATELEAPDLLGLKLLREEFDIRNIWKGETTEIPLRQIVLDRRYVDSLTEESLTTEQLDNIKNRIDQVVERYRKWPDTFVEEDQRWWAYKLAADLMEMEEEWQGGPLPDFISRLTRASASIVDREEVLNLYQAMDTALFGEDLREARRLVLLFTGRAKEEPAIYFDLQKQLQKWLKNEKTLLWQNEDNLRVLKQLVEFIDDDQIRSSISERASTYITIYQAFDESDIDTLRDALKDFRDKSIFVQHFKDVAGRTERPEAASKVLDLLDDYPELSSLTRLQRKQLKDVLDRYIQASQSDSISFVQFEYQFESIRKAAEDGNLSAAIVPIINEMQVQIARRKEDEGHEQKVQGNQETRTSRQIMFLVPLLIGLVVMAVIGLMVTGNFPTSERESDADTNLYITVANDDGEPVPVYEFANPDSEQLNVLDVNGGDRLLVRSVSPDESWIEIQLVDGSTGWVARSAVTLSGPLSLASVATSTPTGTATNTAIPTQTTTPTHTPTATPTSTFTLTATTTPSVTPDNAATRQVQQQTEQVLSTEQAQATQTAIANITATVAAFTDTPAPTSTDLPTATATPNRPLFTLLRDVDVKAEPDPGATTLETVAAGTTLDITGISQDDRWYQVLLFDGNLGWVPNVSAGGTVAGNEQDIVAIVPSPTPTLTPTATPTATSTATFTATPTPTVTPDVDATSTQTRLDVDATATQEYIEAQDARIIGEVVISANDRPVLYPNAEARVTTEAVPRYTGIQVTQTVEAIEATRTVMEAEGTPQSGWPELPSVNVINLAAPGETFSVLDFTTVTGLDGSEYVSRIQILLPDRREVWINLGGNDLTLTPTATPTATAMGTPTEMAADTPSGSTTLLNCPCGVYPRADLNLYFVEDEDRFVELVDPIPVTIIAQAEGRTYEVDSDQSSTWYQIRYDEGEQGWVHARHIDASELVDADLPITPFFQMNTVAINPSVAPYRDAPAIAEIATTATADLQPPFLRVTYAVLDPTDNNRGWVEVMLNEGNTGWIRLEQGVLLDPRAAQAVTAADERVFARVIRPVKGLINHVIGERSETEYVVGDLLHLRAQFLIGRSPRYIIQEGVLWLAIEADTVTIIGDKTVPANVRVGEVNNQILGRSSASIRRDPAVDDQETAPTRPNGTFLLLTAEDVEGEDAFGQGETTWYELIDDGGFIYASLVEIKND